MDAEQLRDSVLFVSGNLDTAWAGPRRTSHPVTRRTVYGKVSRYKLDEYLQLFDFPTPNISAEKRFTTTVPLQRLFLMNSDFMQIKRRAARDVAPKPDNGARIRRLIARSTAATPKPEGATPASSTGRPSRCSNTRSESCRGEKGRRRTRRPKSRSEGAPKTGRASRNRAMAA